MQGFIFKKSPEQHISIEIQLKGEKIVKEKPLKTGKKEARGRSETTVMTMDREKERELELESAMYTNCLLLGLDPNVIGLGASNGTPRVGLFRHSNPKLGEQLLYFILSSLRGPAQSAKVRFSLHCISPSLSRSLVRNWFFGILGFEHSVWLSAKFSVLESLL